MPWESIVFIVAVAVAFGLWACNLPTGQSREDRRVARLMRKGKT